ncbi:hypothetical protein TrVGV298_008176 [Trichoderma virens]|nr:hypothetical protein TrVGV298_008176 [Trichoderma virens]
MGHYDFFWDVFEDGGNGGTATNDAQSDVKQAIRVWLRQLNPNEQLRGLLALLQPPDAFYYIVPKGTFNTDGATAESWGSVNFYVMTKLQQDTEPPLGDFTDISVPRQQVWKQWGHVGNADPAKLADWDILPSPAFIDWPKCSSLIVHWKEGKFETANGTLVQPKTQVKLKQAAAIVYTAAGQPHFRYFKVCRITEPKHSSKSDDFMHVTVQLKNDKMELEGQAVNAHIYYDKFDNYVGHRIYVDSRVDEEWELNMPDWSEKPSNDQGMDGAVVQSDST